MLLVGAHNTGFSGQIRKNIIQYFLVKKKRKKSAFSEAVMLWLSGLFLIKFESKMLKSLSRGQVL